MKSPTTTKIIRSLLSEELDRTGDDVESLKQQIAGNLDDAAGVEDASKSLIALARLYQYESRVAELLRVMPAVADISSYVLGQIVTLGDYPGVTERAGVVASFRSAVLADWKQLNETAAAQVPAIEEESLEDAMNRAAAASPLTDDTDAR